MIDLHTHSTASDGLLSPSGLVRKAARLGLHGLALTDHDTTAGIDEAVAAGREHGVQVVAGIELGVAAPWSPPDSAQEIHLLGYFVDPHDRGLAAAVERMRRSREERAPHIVRRLHEHGVALSLADVAREAGGSVLGRPHVARALVAAGAVPDVDTAFSRFLGNGRSCHVARDLLPASEALAVIRGAGGLPVLAHPGLCSIHVDELADRLPGLREQGLEGMECGHPSHSAGLPRRLERIAAAHGLLVTAGSDYHGPGHKEGLRLGHAAPRSPIPDALLRALRKRRKEIFG